MPISDCPMCLGRMKQIGCSHLMPACLYETCRAENSEPITVSDQIVMETSRQTQDYLLCVGKGSCEERLNLGGEAWTLPMLMKKTGRSDCMTSWAVIRSRLMKRT